jgi:choline dehydrogenase-like flavoprotein
LIAETIAPGADGADLALRAARALTRSIDASQVRQLRWSLRAFDSRLVCLLLTGRPTRFTDRQTTARERFLLDWGRSRLPQRRSVFTTWRKLLGSLALAALDADGANPLLTAMGYTRDDPPVTADPTPVRPFELPPAGPDPHEPVELEADAVVVGSGAGGGVIAAALAAAGRSVVVLDAGPYVTEATMPRDEYTAFDTMYLAHGLSATWDASITAIAGSVVGGGTTVNWMTTLPAWPAVRERWAEDHGIADVVGPTWEADVAALTAELGVTEATSIPPKDAAILRGAEALGWRAQRIPRNSPGCDDCGSCPFGCVRGAKRSGLRVHLASAFRDGARIVPDATVRRVLLEGGRAVGIEGIVGREAWRRIGIEGGPVAPRPRRLVVRAPRVVVAAGALRTPVVLARSRLDHPAIGANLRVHPVPYVVGRFEEPVEMWRGIMQAATVTEFVDAGPDRTGYVIESAPGHPGLGGVAIPWASGAQFLERAAVLPRLAPFIAIVRDGGAGTVRPTRRGGVRVDYRLDIEGRATIHHALERMVRLARAAGAEWISVPSLPEWRLEPDVLADDGAFERRLADVRRLDLGPNRIGLFSAHQMGTARAGADPRRHACDPGGRVRASVRGDLVQGLYVGDGSLFPTGIGVNPMLTVMALARGVARSILADG